MNPNTHGVQGSRVVTAQRLDYATRARNTPYGTRANRRLYTVLEDYSAPKIPSNDDGTLVRQPPEPFFVEWRTGALTLLNSDGITQADLPSSFAPGAVPLRIVIRWSDGQLGQELVADLASAGSVLIPNTEKVDIQLSIPPLAAPGGAPPIVSFDGSECAVVTNDDSPTGEALGASGAGLSTLTVLGETTMSAGYGAPSSFPLPLRLTDWFSLSTYASGEDTLPGFCFVPVPRFARRFRWSSLGIGGAATVQARWALDVSATATPPTVLGSEVPPDDQAEVPGHAQGVWFQGDPINDANVDAVWTLQL